MNTENFVILFFLLIRSISSYGLYIYALPNTISIRLSLLCPLLLLIPILEWFVIIFYPGLLNIFILYIFALTHIATSFLFSKVILAKRFFVLFLISNYAFLGQSLALLINDKYNDNLPTYAMLGIVMFLDRTSVV